MKKSILLLMLVVSSFAYAGTEAPPTFKAQTETLKDSQFKSTNQQDLMEIYQQALANDPTLASALSTNKAAQEIIEQSKALYRPNINFTASGNRSNTDIRFLEDNIPGGRANFNTYRAAVEARQPIYNKQNLLQIDQAETQVSQADKQYHLTQQQLITRVTEAYFDVLIAQDQIGLIEAQKEAILSQLEQAKATFEVGTATITDVNEAQARYDLVVSQEIAARNQYLIAQRSIQAITGQLPETLATVKADINVAPVQEGMEDWQEIARKNNLNIQIQQDALKLAEQEVERANAGHLPTLDAIASYAHSYTDGSPTPFNAGNELQNATIGLQLDIPIYLGGSVSSQARQAVLNKQRAQNDLDLAHRQTDLEAQRAYLNLNTSIAQVKALEQALISSQTQLDSTKLGYEVGVRTSVDVLNAQQQLFSAKRDLLQARYNYLVNVVRLKFATGIVAEVDLQEINQQLLAASNGAQ
jgi:outer membrane protein